MAKCDGDSFIGTDRTVALILTFITLSSAIGAFNGMSMSALISEIFKEEHLRFVLTINGFIHKGVGMISPIVAGIVYGLVSANTIVAFSSIIATFLFVCSFFIAQVVKEKLAAKPVSRGVINLKSSFNCIRHNKNLKTSLIFYTIINATTGIGAAFLTAFALMRFGVGKETLSTLNFITAVEAFTGTFLSIKHFKYSSLLIIAIVSLVGAIV